MKIIAFIFLASAIATVWAFFGMLSPCVSSCLDANSTHMGAFVLAGGSAVVTGLILIGVKS